MMFCTSMHMMWPSPSPSLPPSLPPASRLNSKHRFPEAVFPGNLYSMILLNEILRKSCPKTCRCSLHQLYEEVVSNFDPNHCINLTRRQMSAFLDPFWATCPSFQALSVHPLTTEQGAIPDTIDPRTTAFPFNLKIYRFQHIKPKPWGKASESRQIRILFKISLSNAERQIPQA